MKQLLCVWCKKPFINLNPYREKISCSRSCWTKWKFTGKKLTRQHRLKQRRANAWRFSKEVLADYQKGDAILWIARRYKTDKKIIKNILKEQGIKVFRGRKGITAWNKGKRCPQFGGENHWCWKGGISPMISRIRRCAKYRQWVRDIFFKDNYSCQICNKKGGYIQADHYPKMFCDIISDNKIKTFEDAMNCQELWSLENGRTLCKECHQKTFIFKGNKFKSQILE